MQLRARPCSSAPTCGCMCLRAHNRDGQGPIPARILQASPPPGGRTMQQHARTGQPVHHGGQHPPADRTLRPRADTQRSQLHAPDSSRCSMVGSIKPYQHELTVLFTSATMCRISANRPRADLQNRECACHCSGICQQLVPQRSIMLSIHHELRAYPRFKTGIMLSLRMKCVGKGCHKVWASSSLAATSSWRPLA